MNDKEEKAYEAFCEKHKDCCRKRLGKRFFSTIGGQYTLHLTGTGLGYCWVVECNACHKKEDITDTSDW